MARYTGPKNRIARKFGVNIFGRARNPLIHKPNPPGVHGARRRKKSDFGQQLEEKQKLKAVYGMLMEKQLVRYYQKAEKHGGETVTNLVVLLESRLDVMVYRLKFAPTIFAAQQLVAHGHVTVNGKKVDCRAFHVMPGMKISIKEKSKNVALIQNALQNTAREVPDYLSVDPKKCEGEMLNPPGVDQVSYPLPINLPVVCDFLAHSN
jgi:small subunit ribosomal protein S4